MARFTFCRVHVHNAAHVARCCIVLEHATERRRSSSRSSPPALPHPPQAPVHGSRGTTLRARGGDGGLRRAKPDPAASPSPRSLLLPRPRLARGAGSSIEIETGGGACVAAVAGVGCPQQEARLLFKDLELLLDCIHPGLARWNSLRLLVGALRLAPARARSRRRRVSSSSRRSDCSD